MLLTKTGPRCISFRCKITVSLAQGAVHDAEADVADPVFVRSTIDILNFHCQMRPLLDKGTMDLAPGTRYRHQLPLPWWDCHPMMHIVKDVQFLGPSGKSSHTFTQDRTVPLLGLCSALEVRPASVSRLDSADSRFLPLLAVDLVRSRQKGGSGSCNRLHTAGSVFRHPVSHRAPSRYDHVALSTPQSAERWPSTRREAPLGQTPSRRHSLSA